PRGGSASPARFDRLLPGGRYPRGVQDAGGAGRKGRGEPPCRSPHAHDGAVVDRIPGSRWQSPGADERDTEPGVKTFYTIGAILGAALPCSQLAVWLHERGLAVSSFAAAIVSNRISAFAWLDVLVSALVLRIS